MGSQSLRHQVVSPKSVRLSVTVVAHAWDEDKHGSPELEVGLSDGRTLSFRWDSTHSYVGARLAPFDSDDWTDLPLTSALGLALEVKGLVEQLVERAERWMDEERAQDVGGDL